MKPELLKLITLARNEVIEIKRLYAMIDDTCVYLTENEPDSEATNSLKLHLLNLKFRQDRLDLVFNQVILGKLPRG